MTTRQMLYSNIKGLLEERKHFLNSFITGQIEISEDQISSFFSTSGEIYKIAGWPEDAKEEINISMFNEISGDYYSNQCSVKNNQRCLKIVEELLGLYVGLNYHNEYRIGSSSINRPIQEAILQLIIESSSTIPQYQILVSSVGYKLTEDPIKLRSLLLHWNESNPNPFFNLSGELIKTQIESKQEFTQATNLFTIAYFTLLQSFTRKEKDDQYRTMEIASNYMTKLSPLIFPKLKDIKENPLERIQYNYIKFYRHLDILKSYFTFYGDSRQEKSVIELRSWAKVYSKTLTPSCSIRFMLHLWGRLTSFGTDVIVPTLLLAIVFFMIALVSFFSLPPHVFSLRSFLIECLNYLALNKHNHPEVCSIQLFVEVIWIFYFPLYLSYLVGFFAAWK